MVQPIGKYSLFPKKKKVNRLRKPVGRFDYFFIYLCIYLLVSHVLGTPSRSAAGPGRCSGGASVASGSTCRPATGWQAWLEKR